MRLLYSKIKDSEALKHDIEMFDRMDENDPNHSRDHLLKCMDRCIERKRQRKVESDYNKQIGRMFSAPVKDGVIDGAAATETKNAADKRKEERKASKAKKKEARSQSTGGGNNNNNNPNPKAKAKAKGKARAKSEPGGGRRQGAPAETAAPGETSSVGREKSAPRLQAMLNKVCWHFNHGGCKFSTADCSKEHTMVKANEKDSIPCPRSVSRTEDSAAASAGGGGAGGGKGKGKGKGKDKGKGKGKKGGKGGKKGDGKNASSGWERSASDTPKGKGKSSSWLPPMYCKQYYQFGKCEIPGCKVPHVSADGVKELKKVFGESLSSYYSQGRSSAKGSGK